jgi:hypothetical protein
VVPPSVEAAIRRTDAFIIARTSWNGRAAVVVAGAPDAPDTLVRPGLTALSAAHAHATHPRLAKVLHAELGGDAPFVVFDCDAVCDASAFIERLAERTNLIPYGAADAFIVSLRDALRAGHQSTPPSFLSRFSPHNVLFGADGSWWLLGLGLNVPLTLRSALYDPTAQVFQAPELIAGSPPSAITDFVGLLLFMRSVLPYVELPQRLQRLMRGEFTEADARLAELLMSFEMQVVGALPGQRLGIDEAIAISNEVRGELNVQLDEERFRRHAQRFLAGLGTVEAVVASEDLTALKGPRGVTKLGRAQRRLLLALRDATARGQSLDVDACVHAGWPGQRLIFESARNRVYAVIRQLRAAGVPIERFDGGYRLSHALRS